MVTDHAPENRTSLSTEDVAEYERRIANLRGVMRDHGFQGVAIAGASGLGKVDYARYFSGDYFAPGPGGFGGNIVVVVPLSGEPAIVKPAGWLGSRLVAAHRRSWIKHVVSTYSETPDANMNTRWGAVPVNMGNDVARALMECGLERSRIGVAGDWPYIASTKSQLPNATFELLVEPLVRSRIAWSQDAPTDLLRPLVKRTSAWEIKRLERAQRATEAFFETFVSLARDGATYREAIVEARHQGYRSGAERMETLLTISAEPWAYAIAEEMFPDARFKNGDLLSMEPVHSFEGYWVHPVRSWVVGDAPNKTQQKILETARRSLNAMIKAIKPGITGGELWDIGFEVTQSAGFDPWQRYGHPAGFSMHGPEYAPVLPGNNDPILEGDTYGVHPSIVDKATGIAITLGDTVIVEKDGPRFLSETRA